MPRPRKEPPAEPPAPPPARGGAARRWLAQVLLPLAVGAGLLGGVIALGRYLTAQLGDAGGRTIAFADIECEAPPGTTRADFLGEAQYLAGLPDRLPALAPETRQRVFDALALHPWVLRVRRVEFPTPGAARAELEFRRPALAVPPDRVVDGEGIVLPAGTSADGLPRLRGKCGHRRRTRGRCGTIPPSSPPRASRASCATSWTGVASRVKSRPPP